MNTPRTDAFEKHRIVEATTNDIATEAWADFARQLERENDRLREALQIKHEALEWFAKTYDGRSLSTGEHGIQNVLLKALAAQPEEAK